MSENSRPAVVSAVIETVLSAVNLQHIDRSGLGADTPLTAGGLGLDSVDILEVVVAVEHRFSFKIGDPETGKKYFRTVGTIAELVELKTGHPMPS